DAQDGHDDADQLVLQVVEGGDLEPVGQVAHLGHEQLVDAYPDDEEGGSDQHRVGVLHGRDHQLLRGVVGAQPQLEDGAHEADRLHEGGHEQHEGDDDARQRAERYDVSGPTYVVLHPLPVPRRPVSWGSRAGDMVTAPAPRRARDPRLGAGPARADGLERGRRRPTPRAGAWTADGPLTQASYLWVRASLSKLWEGSVHVALR